MFCWFSASGTFCNTYGTFCNNCITWHLTRAWDVLQHMGRFATHMGHFATHMKSFATKQRSRSFGNNRWPFATLFFMLQLCENMRREGSYAKKCGFNRNMRFHAEKVKICDLMRKIEKYAVSHVPHLNHVLVPQRKLFDFCRTTLAEPQVSQKNKSVKNAL